MIVYKPGDRPAAESASAIATYVKAQYPELRVMAEPGSKEVLEGTEALAVDESQDPAAPYLGDHIDFVIAVGGDGTILHTSALFDREVPPILSFSMGTLGFLMPFRVDDYKEALQLVMGGNFFFTPRERLAVKIQTADTFKMFQVMNEVALYRASAVQISEMDIYINDGFLTKTRGDGLIVATPTGSTAYSLSCGGSMVHPSIEAILVTPICPLSLSFRPALLPKDVVVRLKISDGARSDEMLASLDGQRNVPLQKGDNVSVFTSIYSLPTVNRRDETTDWLRDINDLLCWNRKFG
jgi:NADH kinase